MPPSALPEGEAVPDSGALPHSVSAELADRQFGAYVHIPFCRVRCGYCDFNTYTAEELGGLHRDDYAAEVIAEIRQAKALLTERGHEAPLSTVFFGGGTPTLLAPEALNRILAELRSAFGVRDDAEITVEANPDSVNAASLEHLRQGGFTRVSFGMQSAVADVLRTLDRTHRPEAVPEVVAAAKAAGFETSVDLIYGAPGETLAQWQRSVSAALALEPHHLSAYALIVERGTKLERQIRRGEVVAVDDDLQAEMYEWADAQFVAAGYEWYELSNWSRGGRYPSRHNLAYWHDTDWWGFGPGAHSHINGVRFWNRKHPAAYAARLREGLSPAAGREVLARAERDEERVLLRTRLREGLPIAELPDAQPVAGLIADGLIDGGEAIAGRVVPTLRGRLLADAIARRLTASV